VTTAKGPQYGSLPFTILILVGVLAVPVGSAAVLGGVGATDVISVSVGMLILALPIQRYETITVDLEGVKFRFPGGRLSVPWSDIESIEGHRLSARLVRTGTRKRPFFSVLDPHWLDRPVTRSIR
jgi:hypothetical protein